MKKERTYRLKPIGIIHSPYRTREETPYQGAVSEQVSEIEIFKEYEEGLKEHRGFLPYHNPVPVP